MDRFMHAVAYPHLVTAMRPLALGKIARAHIALPTTEERITRSQLCSQAPKSQRRATSFTPTALVVASCATTVSGCFQSFDTFGSSSYAFAIQQSFATCSPTYQHLLLLFHAPDKYAAIPTRPLLKKQHMYINSYKLDRCLDTSLVSLLGLIARSSAGSPLLFAARWLDRTSRGRRNHHPSPAFSRADYLCEHSFTQSREGLGNLPAPVAPNHNGQRLARRLSVCVLRLHTMTR